MLGYTCFAHQERELQELRAETERDQHALNTEVRKRREETMVYEVHQTRENTPQAREIVLDLSMEIEKEKEREREREREREKKQMELQQQIEREKVEREKDEERQRETKKQKEIEFERENEERRQLAAEHARQVAEFEIQCQKEVLQIKVLSLTPLSSCVSFVCPQGDCCICQTSRCINLPMLREINARTREASLSDSYARRSLCSSSSSSSSSSSTASRKVR
jgi:hypothetical protein